MKRQADNTTQWITVAILVALFLIGLIASSGDGGDSSANREGGAQYEAPADFSDDLNTDDADSTVSPVQEMKANARSNAHDTCMAVGRSAIAKEYGASGRTDFEAAEAIAETYDPAAKQDALEGCMEGFKNR